MIMSPCHYAAPTSQIYNAASTSEGGFKTSFCPTSPEISQVVVNKTFLRWPCRSGHQGYASSEGEYLANMIHGNRRQDVVCLLMSSLSCLYGRFRLPAELGQPSDFTGSTRQNLVPNLSILIWLGVRFRYCEGLNCFARKLVRLFLLFYGCC